VSGPVKVHFGREWSLFSWEDRCAHAQRVGFTGLGLWHTDVEHQLESTTLQDMAKVFRDHGLTYLEVEFLADFFAPRGSDARRASDEQRRKLFATSAAFDAHHIKVGNIPETVAELDQVIEEYAALCDDAAQHTDAKVAYEIIPFDPNVGTLEAGLRLVTEANRPNGGLAIDTWHMGKLRIDPERLASIPAEHLAWVELSDGQQEYMEDKLDEVINHRELPGEGEFDIAGYVNALHRAGYPGPWGAEILSEPLRNLPIDEEFDRAYETTMAQVSAGVA
jgi:sugar phosphate isomerase/epimerase